MLTYRKITVPHEVGSSPKATTAALRAQILETAVEMGIGSDAETLGHQVDASRKLADVFTDPDRGVITLHTPQLHLLNLTPVLAEDCLLPPTLHGFMTFTGRHLTSPPAPPEEPGTKRGKARLPQAGDAFEYEIRLDGKQDQWPLLCATQRLHHLEPGGDRNGDLQPRRFWDLSLIVPVTASDRALVLHVTLQRVTDGRAERTYCEFSRPLYFQRRSNGGLGGATVVNRLENLRNSRALEYCLGAAVLASPLRELFPDVFPSRAAA